MSDKTQNKTQELPDEILVYRDAMGLNVNNNKDGFTDDEDVPYVRKDLKPIGYECDDFRHGEYTKKSIELLMKDLNSFDLHCMSDGKTHWQDGGRFKDRIFDAARQWYVSEYSRLFPAPIPQETDLISKPEDKERQAMMECIRDLMDYLEINSVSYEWDVFGELAKKHQEVINEAKK